MTVANGQGPFFPIIDQPVSKQAASLVIEASERLKQLGPQPIYIASHRDKFNDAGYDDYWRAVRIGHSHWEASYFFEGTDRYGDEVDPKFTGIEERTWTRGDPFGEDGLAEGALARSKIIMSARKILNDMEGEDWQLVLKVAIGGAPFDWRGQGIYIDRDLPFLIVGNYDGAGFRDFYLAAEEGLVHAASDDHCFLGTTVAPFALDEDLLPHLPVQARNYFQPTVQDELANRKISQLILSAEIELRRLGIKRAQYLTQEQSWNGYRDSSLSLPETEVRMSYFSAFLNEKDQRFRGIVDIFVELQKKEWLQLLAQAYGMTVRHQDQFAITITEKGSTLTRFESPRNGSICQNAVVFSLVNGKLDDGASVGDIAGGVSVL